MAKKPAVSSQSDEMRPRVFVIRDATEEGIRFTVAEEVAYFEAGYGVKAKQDMGPLQASLEALFERGFDDTMKVIGFPAARDPLGGMMIRDSGHPPKRPK